MTDNKQCTKCKEFKTLTDFTKETGSKDGLRSKCRECRKKESKIWQKANTDKVSLASRRWYVNNSGKVRNRSLQRKYGITLSQYQQILSNQDDKCPVCQRHKDSFECDLSVDHCHKTGRVRAILCNSCNAAVGFLNEDIKVAKRLVEYLIKHRTE